MRILRKIFIFSLISYSVLFSSIATAQQKKDVTLDDIFKKYTFYQRGVYGINWMNDGQYYSSLVHDRNTNADYVIKYDITTGEPTDTLVDGSSLKLPGQADYLRFDDYKLSANEEQVLLSTESEKIYRRSSKGQFYVYNLQSGDLKKLAEGEKQSYATFSPDGSKVAFVSENDLYYVTLDDMTKHRLTTDGKWNHIINGSADWVYEEEFSFAKAFFWSPNSEMLAYYTFDESKVKEFNMQKWGELYPADYKFKYPKAGEANSEVNITVYHLDGDKKVKMDIGQEKDIYIPRVYWTPKSDILSIVRMNRLQNKLEILHGNVDNGNTETILTEKSDTYVDIDYNDNLTYLSDNKYFIRTSEQDGYKHIYLYKMNGQLVRQITKGNWEVASLEGVDEDNDLIYFLSTEDSPLERHLYVVNFKGKRKTRLTEEAGWNSTNFSNDFKYYILNHSAAGKPLTVSLHKAPSGKLIKVLEDNQALKDRMKQFNLSEKEFFSFKTSEGAELNGYMMKPADFDPSKKYPVLMYVYGGPGSQTVKNNFGGSREAWYQVLTSKGYIVVSIDNRGTGARGRKFKHATYANLGKLEVADQIEGAKYLAKQPYVDSSRIGIWGWSYGGYMSSLALFKGNDIFKTAIAVAPVTTWRFYDTIYTERYLKRPQDNAEGYDANSPINHVDKLKGNYFLIHGTGDDNVHFQNAVALVDALIDANKQFDVFYYPNRNHGIYGGNTTFHLYNMMTDYLLENL